MTQEDNKLDANFHKINAHEANANSYQHANRKKVNNRSWTNHKRCKFTPTKGYRGVSVNICHHRAHLNSPKAQHQWSDYCHNPRGRNFIGEYKSDNKRKDNSNRNTQITSNTNMRNNAPKQGNYRNCTWNPNTNNNSNYHKNKGARQQEHHYQDNSTVQGNTIAVSNSTQSQGNSFQSSPNSTNSALKNQQQSNSWAGECHAFDAIAQHHPASFKQDETVNLIKAAVKMSLDLIRQERVCTIKKNFKKFWLGFLSLFPLAMVGDQNNPKQISLDIG